MKTTHIATNKSTFPMTHCAVVIVAARTIKGLTRVFEPSKGLEYWVDNKNLRAVK